jgi:xanthine dehydrogenase accessory factor
LKPAATFLLRPNGAIVAAMPDAHVTEAAENRLREHLERLSARPLPYDAGGVAYLPSLRRCRLVIVGGGHVGKAVGDLAVDLDFDVWAIDDRAEYVSEVRFPRAERRIAGNLEQVLPELEITPNTYCLIVTRGHNHDERALFHLARRGAAFVGMIGSKRKIRMIFDDLLAEGIPQEVLDRVHTPVGLDIGSRTVPEIAISIAAELIEHRNKPTTTKGTKSTKKDR